MAKIHTVIFDLDGTLSDSAILTMAAFQRILPNYSIPVPSIGAVRRTIGHPNPEFYYILFPKIAHDIVTLIGQEVELMELEILDSLKNKILFDGCLELLSQLYNNGMQLHIASTGDKEHVYSILFATGIQNFFSSIYCQSPDKIEMLRMIIGDNEKIGHIMVGDMEKDSDSARANSIRSVGACYGYCDKERSDFDYYIDKPSELWEILEEH